MISRPPSTHGFRVRNNLGVVTSMNSAHFKSLLLPAYLDTGLFGIAKVALEAGADLNLTDAQGNSLLHKAAMTNNVNATKILLEEGGMNVDHRNGLGMVYYFSN